MRVLVTGGAGYIGSHACKALAAAGHEPIVYDNLRTGHRWAARWGPFVHGDIHDVPALVEAMRTHHADIVMHFAALAYVGESVYRPDLYYRANISGTLALLEAMKIVGIERIVFSSTCATYGVPDVMPITEGSPTAPINPYGQSKLAVEHILADYARAFGLGSVALRYFNVGGSDHEGELGEEHDPETHLIPLVLKAAAGEIPHISILGDDYDTADGTCVRDYIHVADIAAAHVTAMDIIEPSQRKSLNLGTGHGFSVREVIEAASAVTGRDVPVRVAERRPGDPPTLAADASAARELLGWTPGRSTLPTMIESAWAWMTDHRTSVRLPSVLDRRNGRPPASQ